MISENDSDVDFLEDIKNTKGLGEKVMTILFTNNIVTFEEALSIGIKGLVALSGIGPKKAEGVIKLAEKIQGREATKVLQTESPETASKEGKESSERTEKITEELKESAIVGGEEDVEDEEIPIEELSALPPHILEVLKTNGFETLAELSVTPLEELITIEEIDEDMGRKILEKVKQQLGNLENV